MLLGITSLAVSLLDSKTYIHMQLVPHMTKYHQVSCTPGTVQLTVQFWRILVHPFAFANSTELVMGELLLYNIGVGIER